ncbi:MAG: SpaA isopeptide-forming pilin-related protein [Chloroflexota bacterium]|nr:hypothetical protein [Chloroflexia bacterium]MDQ3226175.1 SpaA isopeptide-forming pilin-related protein [Chloroflexota bacterium]
MEHHEFDRLVRRMATGLSRRSVLRRAAGSAIVAPLTIATSMAAAAGGNDDENTNKDKSKDKNKEKDNGQNRGNQSDPVVQTNNQVCAGDNCNQTNQQAVGGQISQTVIAGGQELLGTPPSYWVDVACTFDAPAYRTVCDCTGRSNDGAPAVQKITLPAADICAFVISEEMRPGKARPADGTNIASGGEANAGNGGVANADASGGTVSVGDVEGDGTNIAIDASGGTASADASGGDNNVAIAGGGQIDQSSTQIDDFSKLTLTLEGNVVPGRPATYWVDTDRGRRPATGPALVQVAEEQNSTGAIIAEAWLCPIGVAAPDYDWFGQCTTPVTDMAFNLYNGGDTATPLTTLATNAQGRARFGDLAAGTYNLQPGAALGGDGDIWCYAESDRVDANGSVLVEADLESHVWSFVCGGPRGS